jgi:hypothetical protein
VAFTSLFDDANRLLTEYGLTRNIHSFKTVYYGAHTAVAFLRRAAERRIVEHDEAIPF